MEDHEVKIVKATEKNYHDYYLIRRENKNLYWTGYEKAPDYERFKSWFLDRLNDQDRDIYLLYKNDCCLGSLHIDYYHDYAAIGYSVMEAFEGKGYGTYLVECAIRIIKEVSAKRSAVKRIKAWINSLNKGSIKVVERNGFKKTENNQLRKWFGKEMVYYEFELAI